MVIIEKNVELNKPFDYSHVTQGACKASFVTLKSPSVRNLKYLAPLKQKFTRALTQIQQNAQIQQNKNISESIEQKQEDEEEITGALVVQIIESSNEDIESFLENFSKFVVESKLILIENETHFTHALLESMDIDDFYNIMGEYLATFIVASLLK